MLQISAAVGLTGYWSWRNGQTAVQDLSEHLREELSEHIGHQLDSYLYVPQALVDSKEIAFEVGLLDLQDREHLRLSFWHEVKPLTLSYLLVGLETGEFLAVGHFFGDARLTVDEVVEATPGEGGLLSSRLMDAQGQPSATADDLGLFLAKEEGWYQAALRKGERTWSPVYNWLVEPYNLSIALSQPLYSEPGPNGQRQLLGVLAAEQQLTTISSFLKELDISPSGKAFIVDRSYALTG